MSQLTDSDWQKSELAKRTDSPVVRLEVAEHLDLKGDYAAALCMRLIAALYAREPTETRADVVRRFRNDVLPTSGLKEWRKTAEFVDAALAYDALHKTDEHGRRVPVLAPKAAPKAAYKKRSEAAVHRCREAEVGADFFIRRPYHLAYADCRMWASASLTSTGSALPSPVHLVLDAAVPFSIKCPWWNWQNFWKQILWWWPIEMVQLLDLPTVRYEVNTNPEGPYAQATMELMGGRTTPVGLNRDEYHHEVSFRYRDDHQLGSYMTPPSQVLTERLLRAEWPSVREWAVPNRDSWR